MSNTGLFEFLKNAGFILILLYLSIRDLKDNTIPNAAIGFAIGLWAIYPVLAQKNPADYYPGRILTGACFAGAVLVVTRLISRVLKTASFGMGDIKLLFVICLYLGFWKSVYMLFAALVLGVGAFLLYKRSGALSPGGGTFAFGPCLAVSACMFIVI